MDNIKFIITKSHLKNKKYDGIFLNEYDKPLIIPFGQKNASDYTIHGDILRRERYRQRHQQREDWETPFNAGSLSFHLLWGDSTNLNTNIRNFKKKFDLK
jgi:hypothetical protein